MMKEKKTVQNYDHRDHPVPDLAGTKRLKPRFIASFDEALGTVLPDEGVRNAK